jgi:hypothetical protein
VGVCTNINNFSNVKLDFMRVNYCLNILGGSEIKIIILGKGGSGSTLRFLGGGGSKLTVSPLGGNLIFSKLLFAKSKVL